MTDAIPISIVDAFAAFVADMKARAATALAPAVYTSDNLPPGYRSRAAFHEACREGRIPGAHKVGKQWAVRCDQYHAPRALPPKPASADTDDPVTKAERTFARARSRKHA